MKHDQSLLSKASEISEKFHDIFSLFSLCHQLYDGTTSFTSKDIGNI
jgi:hypothetical protein